MWLRVAASGREFVFAEGAISVYRRYSHLSKVELRQSRADALAVIDNIPTYHHSCTKCIAILENVMEYRRAEYVSAFEAVLVELYNVGKARLIPQEILTEIFVHPFILKYLPRLMNFYFRKLVKRFCSPA